MKPCLSLSEYVADQEKYFTSDSSFVFLEGEHYLDSLLKLKDISNVHLKGNSVNVTVIMTPDSGIVLDNVYSQLHSVHWTYCVMAVGSGKLKPRLHGHSDPDPDPDWLRLHRGKVDSNPDSDHLSHVDCDPDSNPDSGPGARVNAALHCSCNFRQLR